MWGVLSGSTAWGEGRAAGGHSNSRVLVEGILFLIKRGNSSLLEVIVMAGTVGSLMHANTLMKGRRGGLQAGAYAKQEVLPALPPGCGDGTTRCTVHLGPALTVCGFARSSLLDISHSFIFCYFLNFLCMCTTLSNLSQGKV